MPSTQTAFSPSFSLCEKFRSHTLFYGRFHWYFLLLLTSEFFSFFIFFPYFGKSPWAALLPALFCLTLFSYLVLHFFLQTKKEEQLLEMQQAFIVECTQALPSTEEGKNILLNIAETSLTAIGLLTEEERSLYAKPALFATLSPLCTKIRTLLHWKDFFQMQELLFALRREKLLEWLKKEPLEIEAHIALATTYRSLCNLYLPPAEPRVFIPAAFRSSAWQKKVLECAEKATKELLIVQASGVETPWLFSTLAELYSLQGNLPQQIAQYEKLSSLSSEEEIIFQLGTLYFKQGNNHQALVLYKRLQDVNSPYAKRLIEHYESNSWHPLLFLS